MKLPPLSISLILISNFIIYAIVVSPSPVAQHVFSALLLRPDIFQTTPNQIFVDALSLFGYAFLHSNFFHVTGNMLGLLIVGSALQKNLTSSITTFTIYFFSIAIAAIDSVLQQKYSLGASGGVSGFMGAICAIKFLLPNSFQENLSPKKGTSIFAFSIFWFILNIVIIATPSVFKHFSYLNSSVFIHYFNIDLSFVNWFSHILGFSAGFFITAVLALFPRKIFITSKQSLTSVK